MKIELSIPKDLEVEIERIKRELGMKTDEEVILYLIKLGVSVVRGLWVPASGIPPDKFWKENFPELPKPEPFWPRNVKK